MGGLVDISNSWIEANKVFKKDNTRQYIQMFDKIFFFKYTCIGQDKSNLQKQIRKLFILIETAACFCSFDLS